MTEPNTSAAPDMMPRAALVPAPHAESADGVFAALASGPQGLTAAEAAARLARHGPNAVAPIRQRSLLRRFVDQLANALVLALIAAGLVTAAIGHALDSLVIFAVVIVNSLIGVIQEGRAARAMEAIAKLLSPAATVLRDGRPLRRPAEDLVPGDVVCLAAGDSVPADLRIFEAAELEADESALTGESLPVEKSPAPVTADAPLAERYSLAYAGTIIASGAGRGVVVATGEATELGRVSLSAGRVAAPRTPLIAQMDVLAVRLTAAIGILAAILFALGVFVYGEAADDMFLAGVAFAVAVIPEGLPAIMTVALAAGVTRMAARNAIVRRLASVETLGAVTVICADKTGTLTEGALAVVRFVVPDAAGAPRVLGADEWDDTVRRLLVASVLCNDAAAGRGGNATDRAIAERAASSDIDALACEAANPRCAEVPFSSARKFMATLHRDGQLFVKGAAERVIARLGGSEAARTSWSDAAARLARSGERVIAVAAAANRAPESLADPRRLEILGLVSLGDRPRAESAAAIRETRSAGIAVKMITGDHPDTARAIAAAIGLEGEVAGGAALDATPDADLPALVRGTAVFARTTPEHKLRIVRALQAAGEVVAMTGDGVNDAPALKRADIGVAMGLRGTDAARAAASMVLADDNFATIAHAVREGRVIYDNLRKAILHIMPTGLAEGLAVMAAILLLLDLPLTPLQVLWVNMVTTVTLSAAIAFERAEEGVMRRRPRGRRARLLPPFTLWRIAFVTLLLVAIVFSMFLWTLGASGDVALARTVAVNALVAGEAAYLFNARRLVASSLSRRALAGAGPAALAAALVALFQILFTYWAPMQGLFDTRPLDPAHWFPVLAAAAALFAVVEFEKFVARWRYGHAKRTS